MSPIKPILASMALLILSAPYFASVRHRNGNFYVNYTDIVYSGGFEPKIARVYNSKTPFKSIFGWGWGFEYAAYLTVSADGTVFVYEYGGGAENTFVPETTSREDLEVAVNTIVRVAQESGTVINPADVENLRLKLLNNATFRNDEWEKYRKRGLVSRRDLPLGATVYSNNFGRQKIERVPNGFVRTYGDGRFEEFNRQGRLVRMTDDKDNSINLSYDKAGNLRTIVDQRGRKMTLTVNDRGLLEKVEGDGRQVASYRYNDKDELVYSQDVDGHIYTHEYDGNHNMTRIGYADQTALVVTYYPSTLLENVRSVRETNGTLATYGYKWAHEDKNDLSIEITVTDPDRKMLSQSIYRYITRRNSLGVEWTQREITSLNGYVSETEYDDQGRIVRKQTLPKMPN